MHAFYTFATRYYTQEVHDSLHDLWLTTYFPSLPLSVAIGPTREVILDEFGGINQEHMLEIEVDEFYEKDRTLRKILEKHKIPFERMHPAFDGYNAERTVYYPDGTHYTEYLDEGGNTVICAHLFDDFFVKDSKMVSTGKLTANNLFKIIDEHTLKFKQRADYYINNEYIFIGHEKRKSIEDVLTEFDNGTITKDEAFSQIAEIKKEGETIE